MWTKIRDGFESPRRQTTTTSSPPVPPYASRTYAFNGDLIVETGPQNSVTHVSTSSNQKHRPLFTVTVGIFDVFMLILTYIVQRKTKIDSDTLIKMGGKYVPCMRPSSPSSSGYKSICFAFMFPFQIYRFFTPMFLHVGWGHLLNNLVYQVVVGSIIEKKYGTKTFGICYILFGFSGNVMSVLLRPKSGRCFPHSTNKNRNLKI